MLHYFFGAWIFDARHHPIVYVGFGVFFFVLQLFLCFKIRRRQWTKWIPAFFLLTEWPDVAAAYVHEVTYTPGIFYDSPYFAEVPFSVYLALVGASSIGLLCAWFVYGAVLLGKRIYRARSIQENRSGQ